MPDTQSPTDGTTAGTTKVPAPSWRRARKPWQFSAATWWTILKRIYRRSDEYHLSLLAAGIAFYATLALFPALAAIVTLYAMVADPAMIQEHFLLLARILPPDVSQLISEELQTLASRQAGELGTGATAGLLFAIWSARRGVLALVKAITVIYRERERRNFLTLNLLTTGLTLGAIVIVVLALGLMLILPTLLAVLPLAGWQEQATRLGVWAIFVGVIVGSLGFLYRYSPPRRPAKWRWLSAGSIVATLLWILGSTAFSLYATTFGGYGEAYGAYSTLIVLLLWFMVSSYAILLGALLNAEAEFQTWADTTRGRDRPMGRRGAVVADSGA